MTIMQIRLDNVTTEELSVEELQDWADKEVRPRAAFAIEGEGDFAPGEHCRFCAARIVCRARAEYNLSLAKHDFRKPPDLSDDEIAEILGRIDELTKWADAVKKHALKEAVDNGKTWPGWKLVEGRSNRKYLSPPKVISALTAAGYDRDAVVEPIGITAMEKLIGKKRLATLLDGLLVKPAGKPTLAPETDPRPAYNTAAAAAEDFAEGDEDFMD